MKFYVYSFSNDASIRKNDIFNDSELQLMNIREVLNDNDCYYSMILLSEHKSNQKVINYIRQFNIIIPVYIIGHSKKYLYGVNGYINKSELNAEKLKTKFKRYPQKYIWDYVFNFDKLNREKLSCC